MQEKSKLTVDFRSQYRYRSEQGKKKGEKKPFPVIKLCFLVVCVVTVCVLGVMFLYPTGNAAAASEQLVKDADSGVCFSQDCIKISTEILSSIDETIDPCDDFREFVCGNFDKQIFENTASVIVDENNRFSGKLAAIIKSPISDYDWQLLALQKKMYQACTDTMNMDEKFPFLELINQVGGWPMVQGQVWSSPWHKFHWKHAMMRCRTLGLPFQWFIMFVIDTNRNLTIMAPEVQENDDFDEIVYRGLIEEVAISMGASKETVHEQASEVLEFKKKLETLQKRYAFGDVTFKPLGMITWITFPLIRWKTVLETMNLSLRNYSDDDNVYVQQKYLAELGNLLDHTPLRTQANYIVWKVVEEFGLFFPKPVRTIFEKYTLYQNKKLKNRADICVEFAKLKFPHVVEATYVQQYIDEEDVDRVTSILENIKKQYESDVLNNKWIDEISKRYVVKKLNNIKTIVGFKEMLSSRYKTAQILQWEGFSLRADNIINMLRQYNLWIRTEMPTYGSYHKLSQIYQMASHVNAYNLLSINTIIITPGLMQGRSFNKNRPDYLNYAVIGSALSHEIAHGFDFISEVVVDNDIVISLWQNDTVVKMEDILDCLRIQYMDYTNDSIALNTLIENFADLIGTEKSFRAYKNVVKERGEENKLPGLKYTPSQLFWIRYATMMCERGEKDDVNSDSHGNSKVRINLAFSNYESFAKDFNCPVGKRMNPVDKCRKF